MTRPRTIFFVSGESSGDQRASRVIREILDQRPGWRIAGLGGPEMRDAGMELVRNMVDDLAIVGLVEVLSKAPTIWKVYRLTRRWLEANRPDAIILVDYPGFNLDLMAPLARKLGIPVVYFVVPQVWAWKRGRVRKFRKYVDKMIPIFRFEETLLRDEGLDATYPGHPLLDRIEVHQSRDEVIRRLGLPADKRLIGMLPGSRKREVRALLPLMLEAAQRLLHEDPHLHFVLTRSPTIPVDLIDSYLHPSGLPVTVVENHAPEETPSDGAPDVYSTRAAMDFCWVKSGTSTLESALLGVPFVILYKVNYITGWLARRLLHIPFVGMPNIMADDLVVPELLQEEATAQNLADQTRRYLNDPQAYETMQMRLARIREMCGPPGSSRRTADLIVEFVESRG